MKIHTTNYTLTFIETADDCLANRGTTPPKNDETRSIAAMQFDLLAGNPYKYTSDDIIFKVFAERNDLTPEEQESARKEFFSKGQACMRSSPLTKRYGWGVHHDQEGRIAIYGVETEEYQHFLNDPEIKKVKAMRSKRQN